MDAISLNLTPYCHISLLYIYIISFDIKINHIRIWTTCSHASHWHHCNHCHYCKVYFVVFHNIISTLIFFYHPSMVTPQNSFIIRALWLPQAWYCGVESVFAYVDHQGVDIWTSDTSNLNLDCARKEELDLTNARKRLGSWTWWEGIIA